MHAGTIHHTFVAESKSGQLSINGAEQAFDAIFDLVQYYCSVKKTRDLRCPLRLPREGEDERHAWLRTGIPKEDAMQALFGQSEGAFVVRTKGLGSLEVLAAEGPSIDESPMMLSYLQKGSTVQHEPILARPAGRKKSSAMERGPPKPRAPKEYALELLPDQWHASLADLVHHFTEPGRGLGCTLRTTALGNRKRGLIFARKQTGAEAGADEDGENGSTTANPPAPPPRKSRIGQRAQSAGEYMQARPLPEPPKPEGYSDVGMNGHGGTSGRRLNSRLNTVSSSLDSVGTAATAPAGSGNNRGGNGPSKMYWEDPLKSPFVDEIAKLQTWQKFGKAKLLALRGLDRNRKGSFVVRDNADVFATLSIVCNGGKLYNAHIVLDDDGLRLKRSAQSFFSLSDMVQFYCNPDQKELPQCLTVADEDDYE